MKHGFVSGLLVLAAIIFYAAGFNTSTAGTGLGASSCIAGAVCEFSFWIRGIRKKPPA